MGISSTRCDLVRKTPIPARPMKSRKPRTAKSPAKTKPIDWPGGPTPIKKKLKLAASQQAKPSHANEYPMPRHGCGNRFIQAVLFELLSTSHGYIAHTSGAYLSARRNTMKWVTRKNANVDRVACPWLVKRFVDR